MTGGRRATANAALLLVVIGAVTWLGGINVRAAVGFSLLQFGTLEFQPNIQPSIERAVFSLVAQSSLILNVAYVVLIAASIVYLRTARWDFRKEGWLMMAVILLYAFIPVEVYTMVLDVRMWMLDASGLERPRRIQEALHPPSRGALRGPDDRPPFVLHRDRGRHFQAAQETARSRYAAVTGGGAHVPAVRAEFLLVAALFLAAGALRVNDLFLYTPDSARYLIWGNSIARGAGYVDDTQPEELRYVVHAPLYPALIAPVELLFPLEPVAVKAYTLLWGLFALLLLYLWLYHLFGRGAAIAGAAMLAFNPGFLVYSTEILSEAPFIAFLLLALFIMARSADRGGLSRPEWWTLLAASSLIGLLREVGVVVTACVALGLWSREERGKALAVLACAAVCAGAWYLRNAVLVGAPPGSPGGNAALVFQHFVTGPDDSLVKEIVLRAWSNLSSYVTALGGLAFYPLYGPQHMLLLESPVDVPDAVRWGVLAVLGGPMAYGVARAVRSGPGGRLPVVVGAALLMAAAVYPVRDARFLAPLLPLMIAVLLGAVTHAATKAGRAGGFVVAACAALVVIPNIPALTGLISLNGRYRSSPQALHASFAGEETYPYYYTQPWGLLRSWMEGHVPGDAVLATPAKELAVVAGGRKVLELDPGVAQSVFDRLLRTNGVTYLLAPSRWADLKVYEPQMSGSGRCTFAEVRAEGNLHLYRVGYRPFEVERPEPVESPAPDGAVARLRRARELIRRGDYRRASLLLDTASLSAPSRPEVRYEALVAAALAGDSASAADQFGRLIALPQVASYIFPARNHLRLADLVRTLSALPAGEERTMRTLDASRPYWEMGYYDRAKRLLGPEMSDDSTFFAGHLWDFHYNFQTGDTAAARRSLRRLDRIDSVNSLVRNFHALMDLRRAVRSTAPRPDGAGCGCGWRRSTGTSSSSTNRATKPRPPSPTIPPPPRRSSSSPTSMPGLDTPAGRSRSTAITSSALPADSAVRARADSLVALSAR